VASSPPPFSRPRVKEKGRRETVHVPPAPREFLRVARATGSRRAMTTTNRRALFARRSIWPRRDIHQPQVLVGSERPIRDKSNSPRSTYLATHRAGFPLSASHATPQRALVIYTRVLSPPDLPPKHKSLGESNSSFPLTGIPRRSTVARLSRLNLEYRYQFEV